MELATKPVGADGSSCCMSKNSKTNCNSEASLEIVIFCCSTRVQVIEAKQQLFASHQTKTVHAVVVVRHLRGSIWWGQGRHRVWLSFSCAWAAGAQRRRRRWGGLVTLRCRNSSCVMDSLQAFLILLTADIALSGFSCTQFKHRFSVFTSPAALLTYTENMYLVFVELKGQSSVSWLAVVHSEEQ